MKYVTVDELLWKIVVNVPGHYLDGGGALKLVDDISEALQYIRDNRPLTAEELVSEYEEADRDWYYHTQTCFDQRDEGLCNQCPQISIVQSNAKRAMNANPEAKALYNSPQEKAKRKEWWLQEKAMRDENYVD
jgi:hypothetical protein